MFISEINFRTTVSDNYDLYLKDKESVDIIQ